MTFYPIRSFEKNNKIKLKKNTFECHYKKAAQLLSNTAFQPYKKSASQKAQRKPNFLQYNFQNITRIFENIINAQT